MVKPVTAIAAIRVIRPGRGIGLRAGADVPGALLITGAIMLTVFTIVGPAAQQGWLAGRTLALGTCSLSLFSGFILRQRTARNPLIPLRIFSSRNLAGANLVQLLGAAGMFGMFFLGSLYLRLVLGYDALSRPASTNSILTAAARPECRSRSVSPILPRHTQEPGTTCFLTRDRPLSP